MAKFVMEEKNKLPEIYRLIIEQSADAVIFANEEGLVLIWNQSAEKIFGFSAGEAKGKNLDFIIPEDLRAAHWAAYAIAIKAGKTKHNDGALTTRSLTKSGKKIYVSFSFSIIHSESGGVLGALAQGRDVTTQYLLEKEKKKNLARMEQKPK